MQEVKITKGIDGNDYIVDVASWWLCKRNGNSRFLIARVDHDGEDAFIFKRINEIVPTAEADDEAIIAIGSDTNWLLWREDDAERQAIPIHNWRFEGIDRTSKKKDPAWTAGLYLVLNTLGKWTRVYRNMDEDDVSDIPHVKLVGIRNTNGFISEIKDDILCIIKTTKGFAAISDRHLYLLDEEPTDSKKWLKPFKGLY